MSTVSRRALLAGASTFAILKSRPAPAASTEVLKAGLVGCGGRGTAAAVNLLTADARTELVAMADVFSDKLADSLRRLQDPMYVLNNVKVAAEFLGRPPAELAASVIQRVKVNPDAQFVGFDAYKKLIASGVDVVLLTTPPGYRPEHFEAAVTAGKHAFVEKPIATDPVGVRRFLAAVKTAEQRKLSVVAGFQWMAQRDRRETVQKIRDGAIGEVVALYADYLSTPVMHAKARDPQWGDMEWQHRNWYSFLWICGDQVVEQHIHGLNFCNWVMGTHPVRAVASGGVAWRPDEELYGNIYDHLYADFVYPNGVRLSSHCRQYPPKVTYSRVAELVVGSKGRSNGRDLGTPGLDPLVQEHIDLVRSIRGEGPYQNQGVQVAESTLTAIMAREAAYSGMEITWDMILNSQQDLQPKAFDYKLPLPVPPRPVPGKYKFV
ncbi:MAG: Gfo/Idh/MocA family protein [Bryobacteraceae bacterium]